MIRLFPKLLLILILIMTGISIAELKLPSNMKFLCYQKTGHQFFNHKTYFDNLYPNPYESPIVEPENKKTYEFLHETKMSLQYRLSFLRYFEVNAGINYHNFFGKIDPKFKGENYNMIIGGFWIHPAELIIKNNYKLIFESRLHIGAFAVKYNPDAYLYGEYLFRYGTYPIGINDFGQGHGSVLIGKYLAKYQYLEKNPEISGIDFYSNQYTDTVGFNIEGIKWETSFLGGSIKNHYSLYVDDRYRLTKYYFTWIVDYQLYEIFCFGIGWQYQDNKSPPGLYSHKTSKFMSRGFLNIQELLKIRDYFKNANSLRIFFECVILGTKNYPFYYDDRLKRTAVTYGLYIPSLGALDVFCIQSEYFAFSNNPFQFGLYMRKKIKNMYQLTFEVAQHQYSENLFGGFIKHWNYSIKMLIHI